MLYATGIDIVEHERIAQLYAKYPSRFTQKILNPKEYRKSYTIAYLASRFAVKEATVKALQTGFRNIRWQDIATIKGVAQQPVVELYGNAKNVADTLGIKQILLSISHEKRYSVALVICSV